LSRIITHLGVGILAIPALNRVLAVDDVDIQFARSGGAGGQNVNKVNTKVDMRLKLDVPWLSEEMRDALQRQASGPWSIPAVKVSPKRMSSH
jgi:protein subunit release factor B